MKLEVGMICRNYEGYIGKLIQINLSDYNYLVIDCGREVRRDVGYPKSHLYLKEENIKKASYEILDLIEVDDLIAYYNSLQDIKGLIIERVQDNDYIKRLREFVKMGTIDIVQVMTHEQFEEYSYKIGE